MIRHLALAACLALLGASHAAAQSCAGVEARVNARTALLQAGVEATVDTTESALVAQELLQRSQLLSAFKVMTAQSSTASDQVTTTHKQATSATAATVVTQGDNQAGAAATQTRSEEASRPVARWSSQHRTEHVAGSESPSSIRIASRGIQP